jgi:5-methylcytosine-specific restriction endonuclease McrBC regulatory subunit McrC
LPRKEDELFRAKGSIEATANNKKWPDEGDTFQITFRDAFKDNPYNMVLIIKLKYISFVI